MNLAFNPELESFRLDFRRWLATHLPDPVTWQALRDAPDREPERVHFLRGWQRELAADRWLVIHWPEAYGGRGGSILEHLIVTEELLRCDAPPLINGPSLSIFGPTLLACGTEEQKRRYLPKLVAAEEIWCLGFSEPNAGSDLASLRTRAERDGDHWVINGQKVWSTYANESDWCLVLVRTDATAPKHKGISCLLVPMDSPGVTVRPLREITGDNDFNEVFYDNVRVPLANIVGEPNKGWQVILTALGHERGTLLLVDHVRQRQTLERLRALAHRAGKGEDRVVRQQLAQFAIDVEILQLHCLKVIGDLEQSRPTTDVSILKLFGSELVQRLGDYALTLQGPRAQLWKGAPHVVDDGSWQHAWLMARALTIASGTSEVQRNIIAQRLLGLPRG